MRTTLAIDDDVLMAAKHMAEAQRRTVGEVISDLARQGLSPQSGPEVVYRNGIVQLPARPGVAPVTPELIKRLDEELP